MLIRISRKFASLMLGTILVLGLACVATAQQPTTTSTAPVNGTEMDNFSQFLLNHPGVARQLQQNPALVNDPNFQAQHPGLQTFLKNHPGVAQQVQANPTQFVNDTQKFMARGKEITGGQAARTDQFLDNHPNIAKELQNNPKLIDDKQYLAQHPQLQQYLQNHPDISKEWKEHPEAFERREAQYGKESKGELTRGQANETDLFLKSHPEIAQQLQKNPGLVDNKQYLSQHPQLQQYLQKHPEIRQDWKDHPDKFEKRQTQYDKNHPPKQGKK